MDGGYKCGCGSGSEVKNGLYFLRNYPLWHSLVVLPRNTTSNLSCESIYAALALAL